jgi:hypothetical protein
MEVAEAVAIVRRQSEQLAKLARILTRLKPIIYATGTVMRLRDSGADFHCLTEGEAIRLAEALPAKIELVYSGTSTTLSAGHQIDDLVFAFWVPTIRKIRLSDCTVKKCRTAQSTGWQKSKLFFQDLELAEFRYPNNSIQGKELLKEKIWNFAIEHQKTRRTLNNFMFVI